MFSTFDLRLLLYVIRLAGWLKHCNLSLSLSLSLWESFVGSIQTWHNLSLFICGFVSAQLPDDSIDQRHLAVLLSTSCNNVQDAEQLAVR